MTLLLIISIYLNCKIIVINPWWPGDSHSKESAQNVGDPNLIFGVGRSPGEENGNPLLQYSCLENPTDREAWWATVHKVAKSLTLLSDLTFTFWAPLIIQFVKNPPAMQESQVRFLGWEDPLEKGRATHSSILAWRIPWTANSRTWLSEFYFHFIFKTAHITRFGGLKLEHILWAVGYNSTPNSHLRDAKETTHPEN